MLQLFYKTIYNPAVNKLLRSINRILYPILPKKIKIPPSGILVVKNKDDKKLKLKTNQTNYLTQLLFWEGYQNFEYTSIFIKLIKKMDVFYDIGANIGYYSLLAEMENSNIKVVGFEPASGPLFFYRENVRLNNFKNITIEDIALSNKEGEITFYEIKNKKYTYLEHNLAGEGNAGSDNANRNFVTVPVKTTTLNNYTANNETTIDLIKMDTEGTEHFILEHASVVLEKMKPIIICETLFNTIETEIEAILKKYGYEFYNHTNGANLEKTTSITRTIDNGVRNCFFVHPSKFHLIEEFVK